MRRLFVLMVLVGLFSLSGASGARAEEADVCDQSALKGAEITTSVWIRIDGEDYTRAETDLVVKVPKTWPPAGDLLLDGDAEHYRTAMRCLLRDPADPHPYRSSEWRPWPPRVTIGEKTITVEYRAVTNVYSTDEYCFGVWCVTAGKRLWTLALNPPQALERSWWKEITVDLGDSGGLTEWPMPTKGTETRLTWTWPESDMPIPAVWVRMQPPAMKALTARWDDDRWYLGRSVSWISWDLLFLPVVLIVVRMLSRSPGPSLETPAEVATRRRLKWWVMLMFVASVVVEADNQMPRLSTWWQTHEVALYFVLATCGGAALCLFGRPHYWTMAIVAVVAAFPFLVAVRPEDLGLPDGFWLDQELPYDVADVQQSGGYWWLGLASVCVAFLWLVGTVSAVRWFRAGAHVQTTATPPRNGLPWWVFLLCAFASVALVLLDLWATYNSWTQWSWLSAHDEYWDLWRFTYLYNQLAWFPSTWPDWYHPNVSWWYGGIAALLAALAARAKAPYRSSFAPQGTTLLLLIVLSFEVVWPTPGWYVGLWVPAITVPITLLAGVLLFLVGRRRAVLWQEMKQGGGPLRTVILEADREWLMDSARTYRDLLSQLRRLEQGDQDGKRRDLEKELDDLHRWKPPSATAPYAPLPDSVDAVELALAWGPRATWWENAGRGARFATLIALPATAIGFWANQVRGPLWSNMTRDEFGVALRIDYVISMEVLAAGLGFVLGALWRILPGRRGPAKALGVFLVYAAPVAAYWTIARATGQSLGTWALDLALTLLVLTVTGVAMDIDTFRQEGIYWPTKASLLLSIYQLRTASVQLAFFVAQVVALVGVWQQLKGNEPMVLIQPGSGGTDESGSAGN